MLIRKSTAEDAERVGEVDVQAFTNSGWGEAHNMAQDEELQHKRREEARQYCRQHPDWVYVAIEDDQIVGFATLEYDSEQQTGCIENNAVLPEYRNRGISSELVRSVVEELRQLGARQVTLRTIHVPAARWVYEKAGFGLAKQVQEPDSEGGPPGLMCYYQMQLQED